MANKKKRKHWWQNIKFKYRLTIVNENTLEEVFGLYVSKLNGLSVLFTVLALLCISSPFQTKKDTWAASMHGFLSE